MKRRRYHDSGVNLLGTISEEVAATGKNLVGQRIVEPEQQYQPAEHRVPELHPASSRGSTASSSTIRACSGPLATCCTSALLTPTPSSSIVSSNLLNTPWVFNVSSYADVRLVTGVTGSYMFQAAEVAGQPSDYWLLTPAAWKAPTAIDPAANQDLRGFAAGAQFIIVTSPEFRGLAALACVVPARPGCLHGGLGCEPDL